MGAQRFHGPAPGKQTGSLGCDDYRNPRLPLPSRPGAGWSIGGGGMWCGPALVPRGLDPGLLGLPGGGGGAPLLGNPGGPAESMLSGAYERYQQFMTKMEFETYYISTRTGPNRFVMPWETLIPSSQNGMSSPAPEENGGDGGGGNGNTRTGITSGQSGVDSDQLPEGATATDESLLTKASKFLKKAMAYTALASMPLVALTVHDMNANATGGPLFLRRLGTTPQIS